MGSPFNASNGFASGHVRVYQLKDISTSVHSIVDTDSNFLIYPNPNNGEFSLSFENPNKQDAFLQIFGMDGVLILSKTIDSYQNDIFNLPQGKTYLVVLHVGEETILKQVVISKSR